MDLIFDVDDNFIEIMSSGISYR